MCSHSVTADQCEILTEQYYHKTCSELAIDLLGKTIVRQLPSGEKLEGLIVETESYLGGLDEASHSYNGKRTERNEAMFMCPGTSYVYRIYGMYYCFNISSEEPGAAVLIRALQPLVGFDTMRNLREVCKRKNTSSIKDQDLCNGPSKLCSALNITKEEINKHKVWKSKSIWIKNGITINNTDIISAPRIGIKTKNKEWTDICLRFYLKDNKFVSRRNKAAEVNAKYIHKTGID